MRILTWNVNVLRTCLDYHPFSSMKKKNVEGLLDELDAQIFCFQEHKTVRARLEKSMACPGPYDGFWTFPRSKTGYSGVCTYVDSRYCVPLKAEEGITGLLLDDRGSTMRPPWTEEERIGAYPESELDWMDEVDGKAFEPRRLDMEGRAVVCDFGLFVLFNLYCPNETNETRRPYKLNFLLCLQERVRLLRQAGREVIIAGDINIMRAPIDSGEGGIRTSAEQHYEHPARRILDDWCAPKGDMVDVVRESWPDRDDMFTCWNQKLDARSANYGSRIDLILCTPGLRPWIKGGDILSKVYGSDHCPVYIDLHETIEHPTLGTMHLRDALDPADRVPSTAPLYPNDSPREAPEPPRFATKFFDEFSGKQTTLKSFFGAGGAPSKAHASASQRQKSAVPSPSPAPTDMTAVETSTPTAVLPASPLRPDESIANPFTLARAAFVELDSSVAGPSTRGAASVCADEARRDVKPVPQASDSKAIDMTIDNDDYSTASSLVDRGSNFAIPTTKVKTGQKTKDGKTKRRPPPSAKNTPASQTKLSSFFSQPPVSAKRKSPPASSPQPLAETGRTNPKSFRKSVPSSSPTSTLNTLPSPETIISSASASASAAAPSDCASGLTEDEDAQILRALADAEAERKAKNEQAKPVWSNLFARKLPPLCTIHQKPCKDYLVMKPGPNKGKRFWLCSLPVGAGYDTGRSKRPREDVNHNFRCDFFLWDSANSRKEVISPSPMPTPANSCDVV